LISPEDIRIGINDFDRASGHERRLQLSPQAGLLLTALLNAWIYEGGDSGESAIANRQHRAIQFVFGELPNLLTQLSNELGPSERVPAFLVNSMDIIHWANPRWPALLRRSEALGFIFTKE
jgi:hypothetical protein